MVKRFIYFLVLNFMALGIGGIFTGPGVTSLWYSSLNQAPWTPPGWVFGAAWTTIMVCLAYFMAAASETPKKWPKIVYLYTLQLALNVAWNPIFFYFQQVELGLFVISALTIVVGYMGYIERKNLKIKTLFILPYFVWLLIATSLNAYILMNN